MITFAKAKLRWDEHQAHKRDMKEWYDEQPFRVKVAIRPHKPKHDLWWAWGIAILWIPTLFVPQLPAGNRFGIGCLLIFVVLNATNRYREALAAIELGNVVTRYSRRAGENGGLQIMEQIMEGDASVIMGVRSNPGSTGQWRSIAWLEADVTELMTKGSHAPHDEI